MLGKTQFAVDREKCIGCGKCTKVCVANVVGGSVLTMKDGYPYLETPDTFGWAACWKCEHCIAACPTGAISMFGVGAKDVLPKPSEAIKEDLTKLISFRRTCRAFRQEDVEKKIIDEILATLQNAPTGGNSMDVELTVVESRDFMQKIWDKAFSADIDYRRFPDFEVSANKFALSLYGAPHMLIAHKVAEERCRDERISDVNIATAYFELLCNAYGLGTVMTNYALTVLDKNKEVRAMLGIPEDHYMALVVGFGYPAYPYERGVLKDRSEFIHRFK